jgi:CBS domain containing-hemolysin-like protein
LGGSKKRAFRVGFLTFFLSISISVLFQLTQTSTTYWVSVFVLLAVVFLGILFDLIGTATTAASEKPFHAMASDRVAGAKKAIELVRKADQVANFCLDVVGDICGTVSGSISAALVIDFTVSSNLVSYQNIMSLLVVGLVSALTVGGKAASKTLALKKSSVIVLKAAFLLEKLEQFFAWKQKSGQNKSKAPKLK